MAGYAPQELEDWTWGEVVTAVSAFQKGERQRYQALSVIAWQEAVLTAKALAGEKIEAVYELFPFWEEEEKDQLRLERLRQMMERLAGGERKVKRWKERRRSGNWSR